MSENEAKKFVTSWLWEGTKRKTIHREWDHDLICDTAQMILDNSAQLRAENERLRRDKERLLNVLEHAALHPMSQPTNHYRVCGSVVKELRAAMQKERR